MQHFLSVIFSLLGFYFAASISPPPHPYRSTNCTQMVEKGVHQTVNCVHIKVKKNLLVKVSNVYQIYLNSDLSTKILHLNG